MMSVRHTAADICQATIGLEVHLQLSTQTKIFCGCTTKYGAEPNSQTCPVCLGLPGALPVLNEKAVDFALRFILAVGGHICRHSEFARKNYFYPDLPKGYQISQDELPLGEGGRIIFLDHGVEKTISLVRAHLEEDAGKLIHAEDREGKPESLIDLNRCGVPLLEVVSRPELQTPQEASLFLTSIRQLVEYLGICSGNMEQGALRCDANVSVRREGEDKLGTRTEIKNLNSIRAVRRALTFEIKRQKGVLKAGRSIALQTMSWDEKSQTVQPQRDKEESADYRFFPEPDLPPLYVEKSRIERIAAELPELPSQRRERFKEKYRLSAIDAEVLTASRALADYFEQTVALCPRAKMVANWIQTEVLARTDIQTIARFPLGPQALAELLNEVAAGTISGKMAKDVFQGMLSEGKTAGEIIKQGELQQLSDESELLVLIGEVLAAHPQEVARFRAGKAKITGFFVGQVMMLSKGKANPQLTIQLLQKLLED